MNLDDADPEQILDEREDRSVVALQQPSHRGEGPVHVVLGVADRFRLAVGPPAAPHDEPLRAGGQPGVRRRLLIEGHHGVVLDVEPRARCERQQIVDRHHFLRIGIRCRAADNHGACPGPRRDQVVVTQPAQGLPDGVPADGEALAQLVLGGQLRADRIHPVDDLLAQGARQLQVAVVRRRPDLCRHERSRRSASTLPSPSAETYSVPSGPAAMPAKGPCGPENGGMPFRGLGSTPGGGPTGRPEAMVLRAPVAGSKATSDFSPASTTNSAPPVARMPCGRPNPSMTGSAPDGVNRTTRPAPDSATSTSPSAVTSTPTGSASPEPITSTLPLSSTDTTRPVPCSAATMPLGVIATPYSWSTPSARKSVSPRPGG